MKWLLVIVIAVLLAAVYFRDDLNRLRAPENTTEEELESVEK